MLGREHEGETPSGCAASQALVSLEMCRLIVYGLLILSHGRRQILRLAVTAHPSAEWMGPQLTELRLRMDAEVHCPAIAIRCYGEIFTRRLRAMGLARAANATPVATANARRKRLIGSIRRECS